MNDLNLLLRAVIENPDEDTPRLMYADAIQERGEPGDVEIAELIRHQINGAVGIRERLERLNAARPHLTSRFPSSQPACYAWGFYQHANYDPTDNDPYTISIDRGFAHTIVTDADTFLRHADAMIWHPDSKDRCDKCFEFGNRGVVSNPRPRKGSSAIVLCPTCGGTRHVPRPCPPTAQPIRRVVLTTVEWIDNSRGDNDWRIVGYHRSTTHDAVYAQVEKIQASGRPWDIMTAIYECLWPGVEFEVPRTGNVEESDPYDPAVTA